jgi:hypothetical protein
MMCFDKSRARGIKRCGVCKKLLGPSVMQGRPRPDLATPLKERFDAKWKLDTRSGCWVWQAASKGHGYGAIWVTSGTGVGQQMLAHRVGYELYIGPVPDGMQLDHRCRNRACVNPAHLEPVTCEQNLKRSPRTWATRNTAKTHCPQGHEYTLDNTRLDQNGGRYCRACARAKAAARRARQRQP